MNKPLLEMKDVHISFETSTGELVRVLLGATLGVGKPSFLKDLHHARGFGEHSTQRWHGSPPYS